MNIITNNGYTEEVTIKEIEAKSILRKHKRIDTWFVARYGMNLYRGCKHNCVYCDGRAEGYYVEGEFGEDVSVKVNAIDILRRELDPRRRRTPLKPGYILLGGGVGDSYQPAEEKYRLTRRTLQLMEEYEFPVQLLTKSTRIQQDMNLLLKINEKKRVIVSFSFSSVDDDLSAIFEPGSSPPSERLKCIATFKQQGIACGMFLMPVIPFITDTPEMMRNAIVQAHKAGVDFIIFGGMTLKEGRQKEHFNRILQAQYADKILEYENIYCGDRWGQATKEYYDSIHQTFFEILKYYRIPSRIPLHLFNDLVDENDLVVSILDHIDYLLKSRGYSSPFGFAAYSISQLKESISAIKTQLQTIKGVGQTTQRIIREILETGTSLYYEKLMNGDRF